ncbi:MAG: hypothetical protein A2070_09620 [Bdellovibrionales bacterium GWC1_52_8]|nr:MAG: hypothetical protein A2Z97_12910 [Bdellovibrionales bacterium GWB1_52_6]OFZ05734.1 MAG: hypothetical protein A2X97_03465 [Bdellovibrionales bacterium GWA1_52_35]OFZ35570.1 MAG: hypothetical protein A2070_09620 [Bdellovibrionales bacterium GWC1_52_8]
MSSCKKIIHEQNRFTADFLVDRKSDSVFEAFLRREGGLLGFWFSLFRDRQGMHHGKPGDSGQKQGNAFSGASP